MVDLSLALQRVNLKQTPRQSLKSNSQDNWCGRWAEELAWKGGGESYREFKGIPGAI